VSTITLKPSVSSTGSGLTTQIVIGRDGSQILVAPTPATTGASTQFGVKSTRTPQIAAGILPVSPSFMSALSSPLTTPRVTPVPGSGGRTEEEYTQQVIHNIISQQAPLNGTRCHA
jgi:hypothetical protein